MTYVRAGTKRIIIDHTEVSDALRGWQVGKQLVRGESYHPLATITG